MTDPAEKPPVPSWVREQELRYVSDVDKTATEILTEIDALAETRARLLELVAELSNALTPVGVFIAEVGVSDDDANAWDDAEEGMWRARQALAQIKTVLR